jgi:hypothetical protein
MARFGVGKGIIPTPATSNKDYNLLCDFTFSQWAENTFCDVERQKDFYGFTRYITERLVADGEIFVLLVKSADGYPRLQAVDPIRIRSADGVKDSNYIDGIWYSPYGEPVAYTVFDLEDDSSKGQGKYTKIPAENIIHIFNPIASTQGRGVPWAQSAFNDMRDVKDAMSLTMNSVKNEALFSMQYQDTTGKGSPAIIDGMVGKQYKPQGTTGTINNPQPTLNPITAGNPNGTVDITSPFYWEQMTYGTKNRIVNVGYGELKPVVSDRPSTNFEGFIEMNYRSICQAVGIPYEFTYCPEKLNNKGGDIILEKVNAFFAEVQEIIVPKFCQRVYGWVISVQLKDSLSKVRPLGNENPFTCIWTPPRKVGVNRNDTNNAIDALNNGITTKRNYYASIGLDWQIETTQWLLEEKYKQEKAAELGVDLSKIVYGKGTVSLKQSEQETDDSQEEQTDEKN